MTDIYLDKCEHLSPFEDVKDKFNKYCAEIMGYTIRPYGKGELVEKPDGHLVINHNPYDDLNQRAPVIDALAKEWRSNDDIFQALCTMKDSIEVDSLDKATKDFIISVMGD